MPLNLACFTRRIFSPPLAGELLSACVYLVQFVYSLSLLYVIQFTLIQYSGGGPGGNAFFYSLARSTRAHELLLLGLLFFFLMRHLVYEHYGLWSSADVARNHARYFLYTTVGVLILEAVAIVSLEAGGVLFRGWMPPSTQFRRQPSGWIFTLSLQGGILLAACLGCLALFLSPRWMYGVGVVALIVAYAGWHEFQTGVTFRADTDPNRHCSIVGWWFFWITPVVVFVYWLEKRCKSGRRLLPIMLVALLWYLPLWLGREWVENMIYFPWFPLRSGKWIHGILVFDLSFMAFGNAIGFYFVHRHAKQMNDNAVLGHQRKSPAA